MNEPDNSKSLLQKIIADSVNPAFLAFFVNYSELLILRQLLPGVYDAMAKIVSELLPKTAVQFVSQVVPPLLAKTLGNRFNKKKFEESLVSLGEQKNKLVEENLRSTLPKTIGNALIVVNYRQVVDRLTIIMAVANLETYLTDTFKSLLVQHSDKIDTFDKNGEARKKYEEGVYESLEEALVRIHHRELNFQNVEKAATVFEKFGVDLLCLKDVGKRLKIYFADRNLFIHRGGRINQEYIGQTGGSKEQLDTYLPISSLKAEAAVNEVLSLVLHLEGEILKNDLLAGKKVLEDLDRERIKKVAESMMTYLS